MTGIRK